MYSYADRLKEMRETKIRHTLEKRAQNGFTDLDDFGTVPITPDYEVEPWYNSANGSFYGYDGMCENFERIMDAHPPYVDPMEMLCGRWRDMLVNYRGDLHYMPDWLKKKPKTMEFMKSATNQWSKRWDEQRFPFDHLKPLQEKYNIQTGIDGDAHLACDYRIGFELGFGGLLEKLEKYRGINMDKQDFYDAEIRCVKAIINFIQRHIEKIDEMIGELSQKVVDGHEAAGAENNLREEDRLVLANLKEMKSVCEKVKIGAPQTFHEVCQWTAFFNCASRIFTRDGAGFQLDELLYPYYEKDTKAGILDDEKAKFLIANLLLIDPHYYQISGVDEKDQDMTNHLSYLILEAADSINITCNLTVRYHEKCDREFVRKAVYYLLKNKNGWPRFCNDKALAEGYMRNGVDKKTARERIAVGCNWMCVPGKEFPMNDTVKINVAKVLTVALEQMKCEKEKSVARLYEIYKDHLAKAVKVTADGINLHLDHQWEVTPELIMNLLMKNTIEKGEDISKCAELYTIGIDGAGLAVVADSFGALALRVEQEHVLTWGQVYEALENNFAEERTRLILNSAPKYCQGGTVSDAWAVELTKSWVAAVRAQEMPDGRQLVPGWFSWARTIEYGSKVGATPNGRRAGEPISHGANPNPHFRTDGAPTAQSNGIASVQCGYGNTAPLQIEFDPQLAADEKGIDVVLNLVQSHFKQGGTLININVLDKEKLLEAHENPDLHPDLVVRVTGFTAYFASLSPQFRQLVVDRFLEGV